MSESIASRFARAFGIPDAALPNLEHFVGEEEMALVLAAGGGLTVESAGHALGLAPVAAEEALERAYSRGLLELAENEEGYRYTPSDFYGLLDAFATFDPRWQEVPPEGRRALDEWMLREFMEKVRPDVAKLMADEPPDHSPGNEEVLLVSELDAVIDGARSIAVVPCNCRQLGENCARPRETCVLFNQAADKALSRGHGRRLTAAEAKALVRWADRKGLMHTTNPNAGPEGPSAICNCCADDCYVFRVAARLGSKGAWPRSRYLAALDEETCTHCGACVKRCHFAAFYLTDEMVEREGRRRRRVAFEPALCWGCGLCANTCPAQAITMTPLGRPQVAP
ncbi:MAG: 4Fe-4S dicluster domain-containing protein [Chloroflexota bacterium]